MSDEIVYFTRDIIPKFKALVAKRWIEGNPICVCDPMEYMMPLYVPLIKKELNKNDE